MQRPLPFKQWRRSGSVLHLARWLGLVLAADGTAVDVVVAWTSVNTFHNLPGAFILIRPSQYLAQIKQTSVRVVPRDRTVHTTSQLSTGSAPENSRHCCLLLFERWLDVYGLHKDDKRLRLYTHIVGCIVPRTRQGCYPSEHQQQLCTNRLLDRWLTGYRQAPNIFNEEERQLITNMLTV